MLTDLVMVSHRHGSLKGHSWLEDKGWVSDKSESLKFFCSFSNLSNFIKIIIPQAKRLIDDSGLAPTFKTGKYEFGQKYIFWRKIPTFLRVVVEIFCDIRLGSYLNTLGKKKNIFSPL